MDNESVTAATPPTTVQAWLRLQMQDEEFRKDVEEMLAQMRVEQGERGAGPSLETGLTETRWPSGFKSLRA